MAWNSLNANSKNKIYERLDGRSKLSLSMTSKENKQRLDPKNTSVLAEKKKTEDLWEYFIEIGRTYAELEKTIANYALKVSEGGFIVIYNNGDVRVADDYDDFDEEAKKYKRDKAVKFLITFSRSYDNILNFTNYIMSGVPMKYTAGALRYAANSEQLFRYLGQHRDVFFENSFEEHDTPVPT